MLVASFGDEFLGASVEYSEITNHQHMHKVIYIRDGEEVFTNYVFNDSKVAGERDSLEMAQEFVKKRSKDGKQRL